VPDSCRAYVDVFSGMPDKITSRIFVKVMQARPGKMGVFKWRRFLIANRATVELFQDAADPSHQTHMDLDSDLKKYTAMKRFLSFQAEVRLVGKNFPALSSCERIDGEGGCVLW
jgi:hypothetical protein